MKQAELFADEPGDEPVRPAGIRGPEPSDAEARVLAAACFDRPLLVEAGAGTGKTATLVARALTWSLGPGWDEVERERPGATSEALAPTVLRRIVAITFTEAAAAEMSARIGEALAMLQATAVRTDLASLGDRDLPLGLRCADLPRDRATWAIRARALRSSLDALNASTIHAYCRRLLAGHPFEVRWAPDFSVDPMFARIELVLRDALESTLRERWADRSDDDLIALAAAGHGPPELEATLLELVRKGARAEDFRRDPLAEEECECLCSDLRRSAGALLEVAGRHPDLARGQVAGETLAALERTFALPLGARETARARLERWAPELQEIWSKRAERIDKWGKQKFGQAERQALGEEVDAFSALASEFEVALEPWLELAPDVLDRGRRVVLEVLERFEVALRAAGLASFDDLLRGAHALLRDHPEVAARERAAIRQLFVDEFQDTDELQCGIVELLALQGPRSARPGLFVVGDPKQSIYAWRNADLAAYDRFKERLCAPDVGGLVLRLTRNFRSVPAILREVDAAVRPVMQAEFGVQPEFVALEEHRAAAESGGPAPVEYWISWPQDPQTSAPLVEEIDTLATYETEARAIAADLAARGNAGARWKDSALLLRATTGVEVYLRALREHEIPYVVQSDRKYYERREVIDATALLCCVLDPNDQVALVTFLRSPLVGVPDAALLPLWKEQLPERLSWLTHVDEERLAGIEVRIRNAAALVPVSIPGIAGAKGWAESLIAAIHAVAAARAAFQHEPVDAWVERLRALFPVEAVEAARFLGSFRLSNLERFFRELRRSLQDRSGDAHSVLRTLRTNLARESEAELTLPTESDRDAVRVLTIHGAKGLEFPNVYLAQTSKPPRVEGSDPTEFDNKGGRVSYAFFGTRSPAHADARRSRERAERAERVRLLYVALTRARDRLIVLGGWKPDADPKPWSACERISELLANRAELGTALAQLRSEAPAAAPREWHDPSGVRFALAADARAAPALARSRARSVRLPDVEAIAADSARLARERERAQAHRARTLGAPASEENHAGWIHAQAESREGEGRSLGRSAAQAIGVAVHRALETLDLAAPSDDELARARASLAEFLAPLVEPHESRAALERADALLDAAASHGLLARLFTLGNRVLARELPVLLPSDDDAGGPVAFVSGAIDLLYRDPATEELVVADYKTDPVDTEEALRARAEHYRPQGRRYVRAVKEALGLERDPRFELWFLHSGTVVAH